MHCILDSRIFPHLSLPAQEDQIHELIYKSPLMSQGIAKKYLLQLTKRIHPDYYTALPKAQTSNQQTLQILNSVFLSSGNLGSASSQYHDLVLFVKKSSGKEKESLERVQWKLSSSVGSGPPEDRLLNSLLGLCQTVGLEIDPEDARTVNSSFKKGNVPVDRNARSKKNNRNHHNNHDPIFPQTYRSSHGFSSPSHPDTPHPNPLHTKNVFYHSSLTALQKSQALNRFITHSTSLSHASWSDVPLLFHKEFKSDVHGFIVVPWDFDPGSFKAYLVNGGLERARRELRDLVSVKS